jgi:glycosyltransferase involved in cell wall biosynthesis
MKSIFVDFTHVHHRPITGLERIALELFSSDALKPLTITHIMASTRQDMVARQWLGLPWLALRHQCSIVLCPGFPPSVALQAVARGRIIPYVHDLFLIQQTSALNRRAYWYLRPSFVCMLRHQKTFLANSAKTRDELARHVATDARIKLYRPRVRDVFTLSSYPARCAPADVLVLVALGTVEPRKNYLYAAEIVDALFARGQAAQLRIIGRQGWGGDWEILSRHPHVELLGHLPDAEVRAVVASADLVLCTSRDEGLGLPLLELQYAGLPTVAVDLPIFREILGDRDGLFIPQGDARAAAELIVSTYWVGDWFARGQQHARRILERYNAAAERDRSDVIALIQEAQHSAYGNYRRTS